MKINFHATKHLNLQLDGLIVSNIYLNKDLLKIVKDFLLLKYITKYEAIENAYQIAELDNSLRLEFNNLTHINIHLISQRDSYNKLVREKNWNYPYIIS